MKAGILALALLLASCAQPAAPLAAAVQPVSGATVYHLREVNTSELRSIDFEVTQTLEEGNLRIAVCLRHNSLYNTAIGVDKFYYDASAALYPVLAVNEEGWNVNMDGTQADGFGSFASRTNQHPAGRGGTSCAAPLVFTLSGDPTGGTNTPLTLALHVRYDGDCSGWVSNRPLPGTPGTDANCRRLPDCPPPPVCYPTREDT